MENPRERVAKAKGPWAVSDLSEAAYPCFNVDQHFLTKFMDHAALSGGQAYLHTKYN